MMLAIYLIAAFVVLGVFFLLLSSAAAAYLKFRGTRLVTCPETKEPAAVEVDAKYAAFAETFRRRYPELFVDRSWKPRGITSEQLN